MKQMDVIEQFGLADNKVRLLFTGDMASEGVNLHRQCHHLIHFDLPWSLITIEQRNGRIDRYGQLHRPQITTLLLEPDTDPFSGDIRVLSKLLEKEREAHTALGDVASLMGKYDVAAEEEEIRKVLAGEKTLDEAVGSPDDIEANDPIAAMLARISALPATPTASDGGQHGGLDGTTGPADGVGTPDGAPAAAASVATGGGLFPDDAVFLREALHEVFETPGAEVSARGVRWREYPPQQIVELAPPDDLRSRLEVLPQSYLADRKITETFKLATTVARGAALLRAALAEGSDSSWPEAHYLGPLHPVLDWAADRALGQLGRNQVYAVRGGVESPTVLLIGTLTNKRGQVVASCPVSVEYPDPDSVFCLVTPHASAVEMVEQAGLRGVQSNPGPVTATHLDRYVRHAVGEAEKTMAQVFEAAARSAEQRVHAWSTRVAGWEQAARGLAQREDLKQRRLTVGEESKVAARMAPDRRLIRPLVLVLPASTATSEEA